MRLVWTLRTSRQWKRRQAASHDRRTACAPAELATVRAAADRKARSAGAPAAGHRARNLHHRQSRPRLPTLLQLTRQPSRLQSRLQHLHGFPLDWPLT